MADSSWAERSVFVSFLVLWIVYGLLNQLAKIKGIEYNAASLVWVQEVLKLVLSIALFAGQDGGLYELFCVACREHVALLCWYMIPAGLYALTDVLTYINLRSFDPATYYLLSELKLVLTAVVHQVLLKRRLRLGHWRALAIITMGCILKMVDGSTPSSRYTDNNTAAAPTLINYAILLGQLLASTVAGVYNEKLLKDKARIPINLQNICLYLDGILLLSLCSFFTPKSPDNNAANDSLSAMTAQPVLMAMAACMATAGIVTSRFLLLLDSVRKSMAAALVVVLLPFLQHFLFETKITLVLLLAMAHVVLGMYLYSVEPVDHHKNAPLYTAVAQSSAQDEEESCEEQVELAAIAE